MWPIGSGTKVLITDNGQFASWWAWLCLGVFLLAIGATAMADGEAEVELIAELRLPQGGQADPRFVPAIKFEQGQELDYTVRIRNPGTTPLDQVTVVQALPMNTHYVAGSATGAGADIQFSIDGGQSFAKPVALKSASDPTLPASPAEYTHIRWQLRYPLAAKAVVLARFRAIFR